MQTTRREILAASGIGVVGSTLLRELLAAKAAAPGIRVGICDWSLGMRGPAAFDVARTIGLDGVEISPTAAARTLSYATPAVQKQYQGKMAETGLVVSSLATTITNAYPLATDARAAEWLTQTIDATAALGARAILLAFFGRGDLLTGGKEGQTGPRKLNRKAVDAVVAKLKAAAPRAKAKGVVLGVESWLSASQNIEILDAVAHPSVRVYYDIANSTRAGYDVPAEIRMLTDRICQFHFKDNKGSFDSGNPKMGPIVEAVKAIRYRGWIVLERSFGRDRASYFKGNAAFVRKSFGLKAPARGPGRRAPVVLKSAGMALAFVPPGEFVMGSAPGETGRHDDETPHRVRLTKGFYIATTEVTQAQWQAVMGYNPCKVKGEKLPVHGISWPQAVEFCKALSAKEGKTCRLPTEAEWEYACRAGSKGAFAGCGQADKMGWHMDNSQERLHEVAALAPNAWGIHDMHGNAMEWTADWYAASLGTKQAVDPTGPAEGKMRVARGGSCLHFARACRSAARMGERPASGPQHMGFRVVMDTDNAAGGK